MSLEDHEEWHVVSEALRYIDEPTGLSPGWKVDGTVNEHDAAAKPEHFLEHLVKLARLYLMAKTMGTGKLMRAALKEIHCAIRLVGQCFNSIQFTALGGVKEQKHCGYESNEPWEITGGRRVIFKLADTFERALSPLSSPDRPFKFEKPEAIWRKALTPDTKFPKHAYNSSDADNGSVGTSVRDNHIRQIWSATSQAPMAIGHSFDKEYHHYNSESPLSSIEREKDSESSTTSITTVASLHEIHRRLEEPPEQDL
ncbi:hypothetical protein SCUP515_10362 [Seiridium cupressi]